MMSPVYNVVDYCSLLSLADRKTLQDTITIIFEVLKMPLPFDQLGHKWQLP